MKGAHNSDALSMFLSTIRHDFTLRLGMFKSTYMEKSRPHPGFDCKLNETYHVEFKIGKD